MTSCSLHILTAGHEPSTLLPLATEIPNAELVAITPEPEDSSVPFSTQQPLVSEAPANADEVIEAPIPSKSAVLAEPSEAAAPAETQPAPELSDRTCSAMRPRVIRCWGVEPSLFLPQTVVGISESSVPSMGDPNSLKMPRRQDHRWGW